jgi:AmmeMemoRadiSam system protein B
MDSLVSWLDENPITHKNYSSDGLVAAISPHDDYLYAGNVYAPLYKLINTKEVVIFGVVHGTVRKELNDLQNVLILDNFNQWKGPYGNVNISPLREKIKKELPTQYLSVNDKAQTLEHSIEALIPFIQHYNKDIKITPIMVTMMPFDRMDSLSLILSGIISNYSKENNLTPGKDIFFLISNDANHYGEDFKNSPYGMDDKAHLKAVDNDKLFAHNHFDGEITKAKIVGVTSVLWPEVSIHKVIPNWCGRYPIVFGLLTVSKIIRNVMNKSLVGEVLAYSDSWTNGVIPLKDSHMGITAPFSLKHWVGYLSAGFWIK